MGKKSVDVVLSAALKAARCREMARCERLEQRINFAYGQGAIGNPRITKRDVRRVAQKMEQENVLPHKK